MPSGIPGLGGQYYEEPLLKVSFGGGIDQLELKYESYEKPDDQTLIITLRDPRASALCVRLHYYVYRDVPIIDRWSQIISEADKPIHLERAMSASAHLPTASHYHLTSLTGKPFAEMQRQHQPVGQPMLTLDNRTGLSGPLAVPYFALDEDLNPATESTGRVWFGTLHWSGNWKITTRCDSYDQTSLTIGMHDFDFGWTLQPHEHFTTPRVTFGFVPESGFGGASNALHRYQLNYVLPKGQMKAPLPVIVNTWSSYSTAVNEANLLALTEKAASIGAELLVIDDGWQTALGDWEPDPVKFPNGLDCIIKYTQARGIKLGLWIEIESCQIGSRLHQEHPEWLMRIPDRKPHTHYRPDVDRYSALLNFANDDVADYFIDKLDALVRQTGISYLKLDMNYYFSEPGWPEVSEVQRQELWVRYVRNIYRVFEQTSKQHPDLLIENCASGAGRPDFGMNRYFGRMNRCDNQDALDVLDMHAGFTMLHLPRLAGGGAHISDGMSFLNHRQPPNYFQAMAGMMGSLSIGKKLSECGDFELSELRSYINLFKTHVRPITQERFGSFHRLTNLDSGRVAAFEFVSNDQTEALVFMFSHGLQFFKKVPPIRLRGLLAEKKYVATVLDPTDAHPEECTTPELPTTRTGQAWMSLGLRIDLIGDFDCRLIYLNAQI